MFPDYKHCPGHIPEQQDNEDKKYYQVEKRQHDTNHSDINDKTPQQNKEQNLRYDSQRELVLNGNEVFNGTGSLLSGDVLNGECVNVVLYDR